MDHFLNKKVSQKDKMEVADKVAVWCAEDLVWCAEDFRPFVSVEGKGFIDLIQHLINLACAQGNVNATELLPTADTVKSHLSNIAPVKTIGTFIN